MIYYLVLTISTIIIAILTFSIWWKTKTMSFLVGSILIYYWTLYGSWIIVTDKINGYSQEGYVYLEKKLFPIYLGSDYLFSIIIYSIFMIIILGTIFIFTTNYKHKNQCEPIYISHKLILSLSVTLMLLSYLIIMEDIKTASSMNVSAYMVTRGGLGHTTSLYTLHQLFIRAAMLPSMVGLVILLSGKKPRLMVSEFKIFYLVSYLFLLGTIFSFVMLIGNRNELVFSLIAAALLYFANAQKPKILLITAFCFFVFIGISIIAGLRGLPIDELLIALANYDLIDLLTTIFSMKANTEAFAAHFSMYGALLYNIPPTFGSSLLSLAASIIPRFFWTNRPPDIYSYYVENVGALEGQGYTIHYATAWFLNFGVIGVVIGAIIIGLIWSASYNLYNQLPNYKSRWLRVLAILAPWLFVAFIPTLIRGGPEGFKGLFFEAYFIPVIIFIFASYKYEFKITKIKISPLKKRYFTRLHSGWVIGKNTHG